MTITDDMLLAAANAVAIGPETVKSKAERAAWIRRGIESVHGFSWWPVSVPGKVCQHSFVVAEVREKLGGWNVVWAAALADEGFRLRGQSATWEHETHGFEVIREFNEWNFYDEAWSVQLRDPVDLRRRMEGARMLYAPAEDRTGGAACPTRE